MSHLIAQYLALLLLTGPNTQALNQAVLADGTPSTAVSGGTLRPTGAVVLIRSFPALGDTPRGVEATGGNVWTTDVASGTIYRVDPDVGTLLSSFPAPGGFPADMAFDGAHLWNSDPGSHRIYELDPSTGAVLASLASPGPGPNGLAWDGTSLWSSDWVVGRIYKIDLSTGQVLLSFPSPATGLSYGLAWDGAFLYLADAFARMIFKLDPSSGNVLDTFSMPSMNPAGLSFDGTHFWYLDYGLKSVFVVDLGHTTTAARTTFGALKQRYH